MLFKNNRTAQEIASSLTSGWMHYALYALMIFFFSYFWVATHVPAQPDRR